MWLGTFVRRPFTLLSTLWEAHLWHLGDDYEILVHKLLCLFLQTIAVMCLETCSLHILKSWISDECFWLIVTTHRVMANDHCLYLWLNVFGLMVVDQQARK